MPKRVNVYFDWQNCYKGALETFRGCHGQVDPLKLATRLISKPPQGVDADRVLNRVKVFRGLPSPRKDQRSNSAVQKQVARWKLPPYAGVVAVRMRPLAYRAERVLQADGSEVDIDVAREKGVDVDLAISLVRDLLHSDGASERCDVAVVFSEDTDFYPEVPEPEGVKMVIGPCRIRVLAITTRQICRH